MATAKILINGSLPPVTNLNVGDTCTLTNQVDVGVTDWLWELIDAPSGSTATIVGPALASSTLVVDVEGSYLIRLTVNSGAAINTAICAVLTANNSVRLPAALEKLEGDATKGWKTSLNDAIKKLDSLSKSGSILTCVSDAAISAGSVVHSVGASTLLNGSNVPTASIGSAASLVNIQPLGVATTTASGAGQIIYVRMYGHLSEVSIDTSLSAVGAPVYMSDTGTLSLSAGTYVCVVGYVSTVSATGRVVVNPTSAHSGVGPISIDTSTGDVSFKAKGYFAGGIKFLDNTVQTTAAITTTAAGGSGAIQYANGTSFAGDNTKLTWDNGTSYFNINGGIAVNTDLIYTDIANNRVGIGTATPQVGYKLDVVGAAYASTVLKAGQEVRSVAGNIISGTGIFNADTGLSASLLGKVADGGTAIKIGSDTTLTSGKIASFYNDSFTTEKLYITKDGNIINPVDQTFTFKNSKNTAVASATGFLFDSVNLWPADDTQSLFTIANQGTPVFFINKRGELHCQAPANNDRPGFVFGTPSGGSVLFRLAGGSGELVQLQAGNAIVSSFQIGNSSHATPSIEIGPDSTTREFVINNTGHTYRARTADGAAAVAHAFNTKNALVTAGAKIASFQNNSVEKAYIALNGDINSGNNISANGWLYGFGGQLSISRDIIQGNGTNGFTVKGSVATSGTATAITLDNANTLTTAGDKLLSIRNNGSEKAYVGLTGLGYLPGIKLTGAGPEISHDTTDAPIYLTNASSTTVGFVINSQGTSSGSVAVFQNQDIDVATVDYLGKGTFVGLETQATIATKIVVSAATPYTAGDQSTIIMNIAGASVVNLPAAATCTGRIYTIKRVGTGNVTVTPNGIETIDSAASYILTVANEWVTVQSDGSNWYVIG